MWKISTTRDQNRRRRNIYVQYQISKATNHTHDLSTMTRKPSRGEHKIALVSASQDIHSYHLLGHPSEFSRLPRESRVIQEKDAIAKQLESTSLITEKPVKQTKKNNNNKKKPSTKCVHTCMHSHHWSLSPCTIPGSMLSLICGI